MTESEKNHTTSEKDYTTLPYGGVIPPPDGRGQPPPRPAAKNGLGTRRMQIEPPAERLRIHLRRQLSERMAQWIRDDYRHPNPVKAERGATKSRLEPDGVRAETVTQIAHWRYYERIGYSTIVDRLNADPEKYPPPLPPGGAAKARGAWSKSAVCEVLRAPKYTGYQVFNRRARRSRSGAHNDPALWVWSPEPVHEPLIPKWMYDELAERRQANRGSRDGGAPNTHPQTRRTYVLRGMLLHACNRRMFGKHRDGITYYSCQPQANNRGRPDTYAGHPRTVYLREDAILGAVSAFLSDRVFGPERRELLAAELASVDDRAARQRQTERDRLQRTLDGLSHRQENVLRQAETGDPDDPFTKGLRASYNRLESERETALAALAELDAADAAEPARPTPEDADLLDGLPYLALNLVRAPEHLLRRLFEVIQLTIRLHYDPTEATINITLPADMLHDIAHTAERMQDAMPAIARPRGPRPPALRTDAVGAPGRTRTCGQALRRRLLYPLSYGGLCGGLSWCPAGGGSVTLPGTRIGPPAPCPCCFASVARCGGSVKRS
jgi:site-specific DNA recombinase